VRQNVTLNTIPGTNAAARSAGIACKPCSYLRVAGRPQVLGQRLIDEILFRLSLDMNEQSRHRYSFPGLPSNSPFSHSWPRL
jgi:hypothetical protein